ncbi:Uma2 family endonuclease [Candidatus Parabeggiatoa sp. HSG14]|uniref:Uma2 family endonuclease n=1 Tax=Candidatus Parabeggiatoa sp. HSG14 TaxID=3055593 RepID=UPI0025A74A5A|nr:Uma2 family endonuclease [Thiotrichales bacterium HSG14]
MPAHALLEKTPEIIPKFIPLKIKATRKTKPERPGWIPSHITENWDTDPFAYQTEEELMPAGGLHGQLLTYIVEVLRIPLKKQSLMLLVDTFLLYRDSNKVKNRIGPDLLLMEDCFPAPSSYDLEISKPPRCIIELTSPDSHFKDLTSNVPFYFGLGVETYLVIDAITPQKKLRESIELHLWQKIKGQPTKIPADSAGYFLLPSMNIKIAAQQHHLIFVDALTGKVLPDLEVEGQRADVAEQHANVAFEKGVEQGLQKGRLAEKQEIARNMLAAGIEPTIVSKTTGISSADLATL